MRGAQTTVLYMHLVHQMILHLRARVVMLMTFVVTPVVVLKRSLNKLAPK